MDIAKQVFQLHMADLRTLLMHGAGAGIARRQHLGLIGRLLESSPYTVMVGTMANKLAQTARAMAQECKRPSIPWLSGCRARARPSPHRLST